MPRTWLQGLLAWLSGLILIVALVITGAQASVVSAPALGGINKGASAIDLQLPVLSRDHSLVERTV